MINWSDNRVVLWFRRWIWRREICKRGLISSATINDLAVLVYGGCALSTLLAVVSFLALVPAFRFLLSNVFCWFLPLIQYSLLFLLLVLLVSGRIGSLILEGWDRLSVISQIQLILFLCRRVRAIIGRASLVKPTRLHIPLPRPSEWSASLIWLLNRWFSY